MSTKKTLLTREGLNELQTELQFLREEKRIEIAEKLKEAISYGDLSENAEYQAARDEQAQIELRIEELSIMLKPGNYDIIDSDALGKKKKSGVIIGSTVTVKNTITDETHSYTLVGSQEANIFEQKISNESPLGKALLGKNLQDAVQVQAPAGTITYTIISIQ